MPRTRILVTLGPSSGSPEIIQRLLEAGVDAFRVNFSHGDDAEHRAVLRRIRDACRNAHRPAIRMADLQGPKIRLGEVPGGPVLLSPGSRLRLTPDPVPGDVGRMSVSLPDLLQVCHPGERILLGDGVVELRVEEVLGSEVRTTVIQGGSVGSHQGVFLPDAKLRPDILGAKDLHDLAVALEEEVEWVALSFVQGAADLRLARSRIRELASDRWVGLVAKVERKEAVENREEILAEADALMVARGDLGIETPLPDLPWTQKMLIRAANRAGKPVIVATQMLLSMVHSARPTRAEVTDVANAVLDGADCLMLSDETAVGEFPVETVRYLTEIAERAEAIPPPPYGDLGPPRILDSDEAAVAEAAIRLAQGIQARAIVVPTHSGRTARLVARLRPRIPMLVLTSQAETPAALGFTWGARCEEVPSHLPLEALRDMARRTAADVFGLKAGDKIVLTAGYPLEGRPTNLVTVAEV